LLTLADPIEHARRQHATRVAIVDGAARFDYRDLYTRSLRLAGALARLGVCAGDRVALLAANGHRLIEALVALPAHGMVVVPLNTRLAEPELKAILADSGARILLTDRDPGGLRACVERVVSMPGDYEAMLGDAEATVPRCNDENALAALFYTGGTTGRPKGVMLTHRNFVSNAFHKALACSLTESDVFLAAAPMFHVAGVAPLVALLWLGAAVVTVPAFEPDRVLYVMQEQRVTVVMPVPTMLASLVTAQRAHPRDLPALRMIGHAGSPIAPAAIEAAHAAFPHVELAQFYGATETSSIVTCLRHEQKVIGTPLLGSCGRAVAGVAVKLVRADGTEPEHGEPGEIWIRGPNISPGYWGQPAMTEAAFSGGWYRSGDVGVLREDDHLFVVDRLKDMIVSGGENVYSAEVEGVLQRHDAVIEAAVFGIPDPIWGEAVHAIVVVRPESARDRSTLASELRDHCRRAIAGYKVPKKVDIQTDPLPKSGPGKILKRVLREPYWSGA
jgi:long-chain acyl-CoA synthetase